MKERQIHMENHGNLPDFMKDFHDQKDVLKTIWEWWGKDIEEKCHIKWIDAHVFIVDYFLWFMGLHGYKLQRDRSKNIDFLDIEQSIAGMKNIRSGKIKTLIPGPTRNEGEER